MTFKSKLKPQLFSPSLDWLVFPLHFYFLCWIWGQLKNYNCFGTGLLGISSLLLCLLIRILFSFIYFYWFYFVFISLCFLISFCLCKEVWTAPVSNELYKYIYKAAIPCLIIDHSKNSNGFVSPLLSWSSVFLMIVLLVILTVRTAGINHE